jgi:hypothetical protein
MPTWAAVNDPTPMDGQGGAALDASAMSGASRARSAEAVVQTELGGPSMRVSPPARVGSSGAPHAAPMSGPTTYRALAKESGGGSGVGVGVGIGSEMGVGVGLGVLPVIGAGSVAGGNGNGGVAGASGPVLPNGVRQAPAAAGQPHAGPAQAAQALPKGQTDRRPSGENNG